MRSPENDAYHRRRSINSQYLQKTLSLRLPLPSRQRVSWIHTYSCLSPDRTWHKVKWLEDRIIVGVKRRGRSDPSRGSSPAGLCWSIGSHCTQSELMSLSGPKHESRHGCHIIALTGPLGLVVYKGGNNAARPSESCPAEAALDGQCPVQHECQTAQLKILVGAKPTANWCSRPYPRSTNMTLNNLRLRFQKCWDFGECRIPLHCHCSQVHSGPEG